MKAISLKPAGTAINFRLLLGQLTHLSTETRRNLLALAAAGALASLYGVMTANDPLAFSSALTSLLIILSDEAQKGGDK